MSEPVTPRLRSTPFEQQDRCASGDERVEVALRHLVRVLAQMAANEALADSAGRQRDRKAEPEP
jgi:hypothetical protein